MSDRIWTPRPREFIGAVSAHTSIKCNTDFGGAGLMVRSCHPARTNMRNIAVAFANWGNNGSGDSTAGLGTLTVRCALEYPEGVYHQLRFGGNATGSTAAGGDVWTDLTPIRIPRGALFWLRTHYTSTAAIPWTYGGVIDNKIPDPPYGEASEDTATDKTLSGTIANSVYGTAMPTAIVGHTTEPSFFGIGDSRFHGVDWPGSLGLMGSLDRAVGQYYATINLSITGEPANNYLSRATNRLRFLKFCTHALCGLGINDVNGGDLATNIQGYLTTIYDGLRPYLGPRQIIQNTLPPISTSTDSWATTGNQTTHSNNAGRITINNWIRGGAGRGLRYFEFADAVESARNSGLWSPNTTGDGLHENVAGNQAIAAAMLRGFQARGNYAFMPNTIV